MHVFSERRYAAWELTDADKFLCDPMRHVIISISRSNIQRLGLFLKYVGWGLPVRVGSMVVNVKMVD